jgi:hypothetical protein
MMGTSQQWFLLVKTNKGCQASKIVERQGCTRMKMSIGTCSGPWVIMEREAHQKSKQKLNRKSTILKNQIEDCIENQDENQIEYQIENQTTKQTENYFKVDIA